MLSIPHMRPDGSADTTHLAIFLRSQNSYNEHDILNDVTRFSQIRRDAVLVQESSDIGQQALLRYVAHLRTLIPRLAIKENELKTTFGWHDGFSTSKKESHSNLYFDLAACLWNLGAFESTRGSRVDRSTDDGIRTASRHFQQAAGYFDFLRESVICYVPNSGLPCFSADCLQMVKHLLLAQAQLCFYEKAVRDKKKDSMKSSIIAKLALQTSMFYSAASTSCRAGSLGSVLDMSWFAISDFQGKCFLGAAEYWQALSSKELAKQRGNGYGEEVARFNRAEQHIRTALELGRKCNLNASLTSVADGLLNIILSSRTTAIHDLSTVYMEPVPSDSSLAEITPVAMVKPSGLPDICSVITEQESLFRYVLPKSVIEANRHFYEEVNAKFSSSQTIATNATNLGKITLSSVGLPGSLEAVKPENPLPEGLWKNIQKVQTMGGLDRLRSLLEELKASARRALNSMGLIDETLDREVRSDDSFRMRYPSYPGERVSVMKMDISRDVQKFREAYENAQRNDDKLTQSVFSPATINALAKLSQPREELQKLFPNSAASVLGSVDLLDMGEEDHFGGNDAHMSPIARQLEEKLQVLAGIVETRQAQVDALKTLTDVDLLAEIQQVLSNATAGVVSSEESIANIHSRYLSQANSLVSQIDASLNQQESLLAEILKLNERFEDSKINDPVAKARKVVIQSLEESVAEYFNIYSQFSAGQTFYSTLQSKLTTLQQSADDLAYTQQWQRQEFEQSLLDSAARNTQDQIDREMALKLSQSHLSNANSSVPSVTAAGGQPSYPQHPQQPPQPPPTMMAAAANPYQSTPNPVTHSGIALGTPVSYPPLGPPNSNNHPAASMNSASYGNSGVLPAVPYHPAAPAAAAVAASVAVPAVSSAGVSPNSASSPTVMYQYNSHAYTIPTASSPAAVPSQPMSQYPAVPTASSTPSSITTATTTSGIPAGSTSMNPQSLPPDFHQKVDRLAEMGFPRDNITNALMSSGGNEELALTMLLSASTGSASDSHNGASSQSSTTAPVKPAKTKGGIFAWGRK